MSKPKQGVRFLDWRTPDSKGWLLLSALLLLLLVGFAVFRIGDFGMGWDETTRWSSGDNKLKYYIELLSAEHPLETFGSVGVGRYPGLFDLSLAYIHSIFDVDRFRLGHWWSFGFGFVGICSIWYAAYVAGSARLAFFSALTLILVPSFFGHLFHNPKDIPFGAMYALALAVMTRFACMGRIRWHWALALGLTIGLTMSVRVAGVVLYAYLGATLLVMLLRQREPGVIVCRSNAHLLMQASVFITISLAVGGAVLMFWWPASHGHLFSATGGTFLNLHSRASEIPLLFRGHISGAADAPVYYVIWMLLIKLPLIHVAGAGFAFYFALRSLIQSSRDGRLRDLTRLCPLLFGAIFPIVYISATSPALHNGMRHFLFLVMPLCIFSAYGLLEIWRLIASRLSGSLKILVRSACLLLFVSPMIALVQLHPYQYVFYNALIGGTSASYARYETEYWFTSTQHALEWLEVYLKENGREEDAATVFVAGSQEVAQYFLPERMTLAHWSEADFLIVNTQMAMDQIVGGETLHVIERAGLPIVYIRERTSSGAE